MTAAAWLHRHVGARLALLLAAPLTWLIAVYLAPLGLLFLTAFWQTDSFTGLVQRRLTTANFVDVFTEPAYLTALARTVGVALVVTLACIVIGLPMALFMAKVAAPRWQPVLLALVLTPLWASYLVKVYAWRTILGATGGLGLGAVVLVLTYLWLPYMVLPLYTGLTSMRASLLDAAADLGAPPGRVVRTVVLPLLAPSVIAGSIFTFSLSLGDYITVQLVGGTSQMLGNVVYANFSTDLPFAAAVATLPVLVMIGYLLAARRSGALEQL
ncbi:MAG: ABC transporter permease [Kineosporiaceae bacterium]|nr:ABC transporter permease [Kineosporiaceae bacterium]